MVATVNDLIFIHKNTRFNITPGRITLLNELPFESKGDKIGAAEKVRKCLEENDYYHFLPASDYGFVIMPNSYSELNIIKLSVNENFIGQAIGKKGQHISDLTEITKSKFNRKKLKIELQKIKS